MLKQKSRALATALGLTIGIGLLAGCSATPEAAQTEPSAEETTASVEAPAETQEPATDAGTPDWAKPVTMDGDKIASYTAGDISIDVYQVGIAKATKTGNFVDPSGKPIIDVGDDIVFINYVITNNGAAIDLGASLVNVNARYADWPYLQGMDAVTDSALYESMGVSSSATTPDSYRDPSVYTFGTGETYNIAANFRYQKGSPINFTATVTPVDSTAKLLHDKRIEAEGSGTIK